MTPKHCIAFIVLSLFYCFAFGQQDLQASAIVVKRTMELKHVQPRVVDSSFSNDLFNLVINQLDEPRLVFTQEDMTALSKYRYSLHKELAGREWAFVNTLEKLFQQRLQQMQAFIAAYDKPFNYDLPSRYTLKNTNWPADLKSLQDKWIMVLKVETLNGLSSLAYNDLVAIGRIDKQKIMAHEPEQRAKAKARELIRIRNTTEPAGRLSRSIAELFLNGIALCFDPHSNYFDLNAKNNFQQQLNTNGLYFGFDLVDNDKNEVAIGNLMPGSSAWSCGKLNKQDVLLFLQWPGKEKIEITGMDAEEANQLIDMNGDKVEVTVRKLNGKIETASLVKQKVENDDNVVKGFVLNGERKIGYINLPSFYTEWENESGSKCATDVAKEVIRLKKEGIEGLILDVRSNGGGAINEAVEMAGIFIDEGPMCLMKPRIGKVITLKDMNRGSIYSGPLALLVNEQSASASELLAATLQDYNRAVIVGSRTFGKATAQEILPADTTASPNEKNPRFGFLKLTTGRVYRVTGKSAQYDGVQPDITLPDIYEGEGEREATMTFALRPDTVSRNNYFKPLPPLPIAQLKASSQSRIASQPKFAAVRNFNQFLKANKDETTVSLKWDDVEKRIRKSMNDQKQMEALNTANSEFKPVNYGTQVSLLQNAATNDMNTEWLSILSKDPFVSECYNVINDLIKLKK